jgi:hypothetical protein
MNLTAKAQRRQVKAEDFFRRLRRLTQIMISLLRGFPPPKAVRFGFKSA